MYKDSASSTLVTSAQITPLPLMPIKPALPPSAMRKIAFKEQSFPGPRLAAMFLPWTLLLTLQQRRLELIGL